MVLLVECDHRSSSAIRKSFYGRNVICSHCHQPCRVTSGRNRGWGQKVTPRKPLSELAVAHPQSASDDDVNIFDYSWLDNFVSSMCCQLCTTCILYFKGQRNMYRYLSFISFFAEELKNPMKFIPYRFSFQCV